MKKKLAILGCGYLGNIVAEACVKGLLEGYELVGAVSRKFEDAVTLTGRAGGTPCHDLDELLALKPDYLVETASVKMVKESAVKALKQGTSLVPLSIGAFADAAFYEEVKAAALEGGAKVHIPSGAVGGFDVLQTVALMAEAEKLEIQAGIETRKGPNPLRNTPLFDESLVTEEGDHRVFSGTAAEAIAILPTQVNVAVASALATTGPDQATAGITSILGFVGDDHKITAEIDGVKAVVDIYSRTSSIAGWSVVALLRNLDSPVVFY
ncbi:MAG: DUF108 domain-containing protein [Lachnospiraceae bacterium]|nr:DUF108 domain-containing protein [Lachnospiraceae bacterium]